MLSIIWCFWESDIACSPTLTLLPMMVFLWGKVQFELDMCKDLPGPCHSFLWVFNCGTLNPEREAGPGVITLVEEHCILHGRALGKLECSPQSLLDSPRRQLWLSCWSKVTIFSKWKLLVAYLIFIFYCISFILCGNHPWLYPSTQCGFVFAVCHWSSELQGPMNWPGKREILSCCWQTEET